MNGELGQEALQQEKQPLLRGQGKLPRALPEAEPQGNGVAASGLLVNAWSPALQATGLPGLGLRLSRLGAELELRRSGSSLGPSQ